MLAMENRQKKHYTVNLFIDSVEELKSQGVQLGPYLRELVDLHVETIEQKEQKLSELEREATHLRDAIESEKIEKENKRKKFALSPQKETFMRETVKILAKDDSYFNGRKNYFNNYFGESFDTKEFRELITKYTENKEDE